MKKTLTLVLAFATWVAAPTPRVLAAPVFQTGSVDNAPLGYLGCVATKSLSKIYCFVATQSSDLNTVTVTALRGGPTATTDTTLDGSALRQRPDLGAHVLELVGSITGIGNIDLLATAFSTSTRSTNVGCVAYPVQYTVAAASPGAEAIGTQVSTSGSVAEEAVFNYTNVCDALVLAPSSGPWAFASS